MLAVGAAPWYDVHAIEPYSSRGPTPDGRIKPDIVGADCGETALSPLVEGRTGFCGTSQAAPHVAGLAALVRQLLPNYTPAQVASYLQDNAAQRETPDPNNTWGHGFALLPDFPGVCAAFAPGLRFDCDTLLAVRDALSGSASLNWSPHRPIAGWEGVTVAGSPPRITELTLPGKGLTGQVPSELGDLANLARLSLQDNELTGEIPSELGELASLEELILWDNQLSGEIPAELGELASLTGLWLSQNLLTGEIPSELGMLSNLTALSLSHNHLSGEIPAELDGLASLTGLWLSQNQLTGEIPSELGMLPNLTALSLSHNQLSGGIPAELGGLASLTGLWLSQNQLTGEIPPELGDLVNLRSVRLSNNQLSGCVPIGLRDVAFNDFEKLGLLFCEASQTLLGRYDADSSGAIEKPEVIAAIDDYLFGVGGNTISKADIIEVINLYLFG